MSIEDNIPFANPLQHRIGTDADARQVAGALAAIWQEIDATLNPIIGQRGVVGLYKRSLFLVVSAYPWLGGLHESVHEDIDVEALKSVFRAQDSATAAMSAEALLKTFHELLTTLVGASLTERLLRSVWTDSSSDPSAQDNSP